jgi:fermentation-respiration switch protein FrsA (DUF1100 family)
MLVSLTTAPSDLLADEIEIAATEFVDLLVAEDFSAATNLCNATMKDALQATSLAQTWQQLLNQVGPFQQRLETRQQKYQQYDIVFVTCEFERANIDVKVVLDPTRAVAGLFYLPSQPDYEYPPPAYANPTVYTEREVTLGRGEWSLPGTLTLPRDAVAVPAVVLVHGSGPQDRDETIGPNKPFRDLAWGLANNGIAVLRYEKRTRQHAAKMVDLKNQITVETETVTDALAAVSLLRTLPEIDAQKIYVLGHSLGGTLIPRIGLRGEEIAGFIIMAGATRPLEDLISEQFTYIFNLDQKISDEEQQQLSDLQAQIEIVKSDRLTAATPAADLPLGLPASYWLDLRHYDPAAEAAKLTRPILILHGERDYQVRLADFTRWQDSLAGQKRVQFKLYPDLNHLFMPGEGMSTPAEYDIAGHVHQSVIDDISDWIKTAANR